jgi:L-fuconolactonase
MIVDTHPHVMAKPSERYPFAPVGGQQSDWSRDVSLDGDAFAAMMSVAGVGQAVLVQTSTVYGFDNGFLADTVASRPAVFSGVCSIDALASDAPSRLSYWITERGLRGVRLFSAAAAMGVLFEVDDPRLDPFFSRASELGIPVDLQIRYPGLAAVRRVLSRHTGLRVVLDHIAGAPLASGPPVDLFAMADFDRVAVKVANHNLDAADAVPGLSAAGFLGSLVDSFGADHLLWGSNFPNTFGKAPATLETYTAMVSRAVAAASSLGPEVAAALLGETARRVYAL